MLLRLAVFFLLLLPAFPISAGLMSSSVGGEPLRIVSQVLPETRGNPFSFGSLPAGIINHAVFDGLVRIGPGAKVEPLLAVAWTQETPTTWVFTLRPNVVFSNGAPFNAQAVVSAANYLLGETIAADSLASRVFNEKVSSVSARDDLTVAFETHVIDPILPVHITVLRIPEPAQWAEGINVFSAEPIGTGPYKVASWTQRQVTLESSEVAWRTGLVSEIEVQAVTDQTARSTALFSGSADIAIDISVDTFDFGDNPSVRLQPRVSTMVQFVQFITAGDSPLKDVRVRQALNYAVNKERLIDVFYRGAVTPASQFTHEDSVGYNETLSPYPYDPDEAKRLLKEAGWESGLEVPTVFVGGSGSDVAVYQQIASDLAEVAVSMELRPMTLPVWMGHLFNGDWPSKAFLTGVQSYDPVGAFTTRSCEWQRPHYCDTDLMPLLNAARQAKTRPQLIQRVRELMSYERDNPPGLLLWRRVSFDGIGSRVVNFKADRDFLRFDLLSDAR